VVFGAYRYWGNIYRLAILFQQGSAGVQLCPDLPAGEERDPHQSENLRLTWQASPKNKFSVRRRSSAGTCHSASREHPARGGLLPAGRSQSLMQTT
jgi:hypothetical protein